MMHSRTYARMPRILARRRGAGAGLVTAIFLLVVLAGLAVALVGIFTTQRQGILLDEQGVRAYQAARAGIEWGLFQRLRTPQGNGCANGVPNLVAPGAGSVLNGFTIIVTCSFVAGPPADVNLDRWTINATACAPAVANACPPGSNNPDYVRRVMEVQI
ncbi:MAG: hypothetical protein JWP72_824 [Massilia sp.]|nr:hypothetical protein [Massilia sp.]